MGASGLHIEDLPGLRLDALTVDVVNAPALQHVKQLLLPVVHMLGQMPAGLDHHNANIHILSWVILCLDMLPVYIAPLHYLNRHTNSSFAKDYIIPALSYFCPFF